MVSRMNEETKQTDLVCPIFGVMCLGESCVAYDQSEEGDSATGIRCHIIEGFRSQAVELPRIVERLDALVEAIDKSFDEAESRGWNFNNLGSMAVSLEEISGELLQISKGMERK
jgi:hypothetical protein